MSTTTAARIPTALTIGVLTEAVVSVLAAMEAQPVGSPALGAYRKAARERLKDNLAHCYDAFPRLAERKRQLVGTMSGGEQQMVALGRAIMSAPTLLIVDEPSVGLAPALVSRTIQKIAELKERYSLTVLMAEQNFTQAIKIADKGYVIVHGEIAFRGESPEAMNQSDLIRQYYLGV